MKSTVKDYRQSRLYKLALVKLIKEQKVKYIYKSKTFKMIEENFLETILAGLEIIIEANKRQIQI